MPFQAALQISRQIFPSACDKQNKGSLSAIYISTPKICEYVRLHGTKGVKAADEIEFAEQLTINWGDYLLLSWRAKSNHEALQK